MVNKISQPSNGVHRKRFLLYPLPLSIVWFRTDSVALKQVACLASFCDMNMVILGCCGLLSPL